MRSGPETFIQSVAYYIKQIGGEVNIYISSVTDITQFPVKDHAVIRSKF